MGGDGDIVNPGGVAFLNPGHLPRNAAARADEAV